VNVLAIKYADHVHRLIIARDEIQVYLDGAKGDPDAALGFRTATNLLMDIDANINLVFGNWPAWINPASDTRQFISDVNAMIENFQLLDRKFNEWVKQFKVK
jgi:hypothetical protein